MRKKIEKKFWDMEIIGNRRKNDFESQNFTIFYHFYSTDRKTQKLFKGLVVGFGPKGMPSRVCNIVR